MIAMGKQLYFLSEGIVSWWEHHVFIGIRIHPNAIAYVTSEKQIILSQIWLKGSFYSSHGILRPSDSNPSPANDLTRTILIKDLHSYCSL